MHKSPCPVSIVLTCTLATTLSGCASIRSARLPQQDDHAPIQGGLVYSLPMQRLKLTMVVADGVNGGPQTRIITVTPTAVSADRSTQYVAQYRRNQIGSNTLKVSVNAEGLLTGDNQGSSMPQFAEFLGQLGAATRSMRATGTASARGGCATAGTYEWVFDAPTSSTEVPVVNSGMSNCGLDVTGMALGTASTGRRWKGVDTAGNGHGYFYRQKRPVEVTVAYGGTQRKVFVHAVVDGASQTEFLPIPRTLFAETTWKITFAEGSPTFYDVTAGGDVLGLVKLPADVLKAYSQAVLAGLNEKKTVASAESEYLKQLAALAVQQAKYDACKAAAESRDDARIADACR